MLSLPSLLPQLKKNLPLSQTSRRAGPTSRNPVMRNKIRRENYYLDASWHTRKSFRALKESAEQAEEKLNAKPEAELLATQMDVLLWSIRPELPEDSASKALYLNLLSRQLNAIDTETLEWLVPALKNAKYDCYVTETIIDDETYIEHGFSNGPPHSRQRTILTTAEFNETLDQTQAASQARKSEPLLKLQDTQSQTIRNQLAVNALQWKAGDKSLASLGTLMQALARVLELTIGAPDALLLASTTTLPGASTIEWRDGRIVIDGDTATALQQAGSDELFARVQRDMLECLLLSKLPYQRPHNGKESHALWLSLWKTIEHIESLPPSIIMTPERRQRLREALSAAKPSASIQIMPTVGAALGHAWIRPRLSIVPDKMALGQPAGTRYMHGGGQPQPRHSTITEWPIRWLNTAEMDECHPPQEAWHLEVPVSARALDTAAHELERDWKAANRRYRFAEVAPDKPASGCRISVWESVQRAMSPAIRECFDEFNHGLPLPGTPTELWERLKHFHHWVQRLATD